VTCALVGLFLAPAGALAGRTQWSLFEDHKALVLSGPGVREQVLNELNSLGADTIRVRVMWNNVAPAPRSRRRPRFDATAPAAYPGFAPYDDLVRRAASKGFRIMLTLSGDAPRWATFKKRGSNYRPSGLEFGRFAAAVGRRYSGTFGDLPKVALWSLWNEPNHFRFLRPQSRRRVSPAAAVYRSLVARAIGALRANGHGNSDVLVGELAPVESGGGPGPLAFLRAWLCLDRSYHRLRGRAARRSGCRRFKKVRTDGFAIHAYTRPISNFRPRGDAVTIRVIRRLAAALDRAARAGRLPRRLPIYNTEFGIQTSPPDPFQGGSLARQAQVINESEEYSYRYPRLRTYSQYLLYDDPPRRGPRSVKWAGFQSGLRFARGRRKPAYDAYKFPVVARRRGGRAIVWGRVRPGSGAKFVQLQRQAGRRFANDGKLIRTDSGGYFSTRRSRGTFRFLAYSGQAADGSGTGFLGRSRAAKTRSLP
jgi:hypothetical protein